MPPLSLSYAPSVAGQLALPWFPQQVMALFGQNKSPTTKHNTHTLTVVLLCSEIQESRIESSLNVRMLSILPPKNPLTSETSFDFEYVLLLFNNYREAVVVAIVVVSVY